MRVRQWLAMAGLLACVGCTGQLSSHDSIDKKPLELSAYYVHDSSADVQYEYEGKLLLVVNDEKDCWVTIPGYVLRYKTLEDTLGRDVSVVQPMTLGEMSDVERYFCSMFHLFVYFPPLGADSAAYVPRDYSPVGVIIHDQKVWT